MHPWYCQFCRIGIRTISFIKQKLAVLGDGSINMFGSNERVKLCVNPNCYIIFGSSMYSVINTFSFPCNLLVSMAQSPFWRHGVTSNTWDISLRLLSYHFPKLLTRPLHTVRMLLLAMVNITFWIDIVSWQCQTSWFCWSHFHFGPQEYIVNLVDDLLHCFHMFQVYSCIIHECLYWNSCYYHSFVMFFCPAVCCIENKLHHYDGDCQWYEVSHSYTDPQIDPWFCVVFSCEMHFKASKMLLGYLYYALVYSECLKELSR